MRVVVFSAANEAGSRIEGKVWFARTQEVFALRSSARSTRDDECTRGRNVPERGIEVIALWQFFEQWFW